MNYYDARQHQPTGRWFYTARSGGDCYPVGACGQDEGHPTPELACACYRDWLLTNRLMLMVELGEEHRTCGVVDCQALTHQAAMIDMWTMPLCPDHMGLEHVTRLYPPVGSQISSY